MPLFSATSPRKSPTRRTRGIGGRPIAAAALALAAAGARAQIIMDQPPRDLAGIDIAEKRGAQIPLDTPLMDHTGAAVRLGDYFDGKRPVVLLMAYYTCPMLCGLALADLQKAVRGLNLELGKDYRVVVVSFDHRNSVSDAAAKRDIYVNDAVPMAIEHRRPPSPGDDVWPFLLATEQNARLVSDSVGFAYRFIPETGEYAHPTALMVLTPSGAVSNYLYGRFGSTYGEKDLRLAIMDASRGKVGTVFDKILWACYHYDPARGTWTMQAMTVMRIGGAASVLGVCGLVGASLVMRRRRLSALSGGSVAASAPPRAVPAS